MTKTTLATTCAFILCAVAAGAQAAQWTELRIGDRDGFGYNPAGLVNSNGAAADTDADGILEPTEYLPDLNADGETQYSKGDDFDNRSAAEVANTAVSGAGFTDNGTTGSKFTDISLSQSYDTSSAASQVYDNGVYGTGGAFPMPPSNTLPNQPGFVFDFFVATADVVAGTDVFFNMIFGDYDVSPANILFTRADTTTFTLGVTTQPGAQDGLIQAATATLNFADVFTATGGGYDGYLEVDFVAPSEPYTAFDVVNLSPIEGIPAIPLPAAAWMGFSLLGSLGAVRGLRRKLA